MIIKLVFLILLSFVKSSTDPPSTEIMVAVDLAIETGDLILPENKAHFIYDQSIYQRR